MKVGKPQSKRVPVRLRHKIQRASTAKQRKQRKEAKSNPQWTSRLKKDPGIPNLFPYKGRLLAEVEENKRRKEEETQRRREVAKAQRQGVPATLVEEEKVDGQADEDILLDLEEDLAAEGGVDAMDEREDTNPMAALLASAQARAQVYSPDEEQDDDDEEDSEEEWDGIKERNPGPSQPTRSTLPKQALADPVKAVSALIDRMQKTQDGIQRLIDYYHIPPPMTATTNLTTGFLVEVARKRGRLGRGGVPNLHSAALTVLSDLSEERLQLPSVEPTAGAVTGRADGKGKVQIVSRMAEPFRIEGLFGDSLVGGVETVEERMAVEA